MKMREHIREGKFWMRVWLTCLGLTTIWGVLTFVFWLNSVPNLNALSIAALILALLGCIQSTLGMRKADPHDRF